ncbi:MAG: hypothetical protein CVV59_01840 [Tenericutes bacterium HGW-Tenericutes-4]|nr:MAG: hypothetical protein CVV59_01840 [Tenericutes bacterium HGW-Tenericutes-4]
MEKQNITQGKITQQALKKLSYPPFLAYNFKGLVFSYKSQKEKNSTALLKRLQKKYKQDNLIIVLNGLLITKGINGVTINKKAQTEPKTKFDLINKTYENSNLSLVFTKSVSEPVTIVIAGTNDLYHYANYEVKSDVNIKIVEQFELLKSAKLNYKIDVNVQKNAHLELFYVEYLENKKANVISHNMFTWENGELNLNYVNLNSANVVHTTTGNLAGMYAKTSVNTLHFVNKNYNHANLMQLIHLNKNTTSKINNFGLVNNNAELVIDGINKIEKGFSKSEAEQESKIINLTHTCKSTANPQLIINEYDVKAGHSAGVGQVDEDSLYYLMSRGLNKRDSLELIIMSHANELLEKLTDKKQLKNVLKIIKNKLV